MLFLNKDLSTVLLPHDWSLRVELRAAVIIPILFLIVRMSPWALFAAAGGLLLLIPATGYYYVSFVIGMFVCLVYRFNLFKLSSSRPGGLMCLLVGFLLYQAQWVSEIFPAWLSGTRNIWLISSLGCGLIMIALLGNIPMKQLIRNPFFSYLGRISYSLYLVHFVILMCFSGAIMNFIQGFGFDNIYMNQFIFVVSMALGCFILADLSERLIEKPCISLGRYLSGLFSSRLPNLRVQITGLKK